MYKLYIWAELFCCSNKPIHSHNILISYTSLALNISACYVIFVQLHNHVIIIKSTDQQKVLQLKEKIL